MGDLPMDAKKSTAGDAEARELVANDASAPTGALKELGGSQSDDWNHALAEQAMRTLWCKHSDKEASHRQRRATLAGLHGIGPRDELEGMIAAQMLAAHNAAMECYRRAMIGEQTLEGRRENLNQANKLSRTYASLVDVLDRHRGKGHQQIPVEHLHLHVGARAVAGAVEPNNVVSQCNLEGQHHAKQIVHAPKQALRSSNPERQAVPVASDAERPMLPARREIDWSTEGE
jgi:hypothetical protein